MGRKGVSKRKPKRPFSSADISGSSTSNHGANQRSPVQSLVKDKGAPFKRDGMNPSTGSNKQNKH